MAKKKFVLFQDQIRDFCKKGWQTRVIGVRGSIILVEAEVPEENGDMGAYRVEETVNNPGEC